jgi:hypothetical protein
MGMALLVAGPLSFRAAELPPEAHGLRLGMSLLEARRAFPGLREMERGFAESAREDEGLLLYYADERKTAGFHDLTVGGPDRVCTITLADERVLSVEAAREHVLKLKRLWGRQAMPGEPRPIRSPRSRRRSPARVDLPREG